MFTFTECPISGQIVQNGECTCPEGQILQNGDPTLVEKGRSTLLWISNTSVLKEQCFKISKVLLYSLLSNFLNDIENFIKLFHFTPLNGSWVGTDALIILCKCVWESSEKVF